MKKSYFYKIVFLFIISILIINKGESQVLINATGGTPDNSAMLEIQSNSKGLLIPRMNTSQRNTLASTAADGLLIFDSDEKSFYIFGNGNWNDLSTPAGIWETSSSNVYLSSSYTNVGIGTGSPSGKLVIKADGSKAPDDALFEIQDASGSPIFVVTSEGARIYVKDYTTTKGVSGGFAVGRYGAAKGLPDTTYFLVTPDSTRVYSQETGVSGGFAVGRYGAAKGTAKTFFTTTEDETRVYSKDGTKGVSGGFAVGRYGAAKGTDTLFFYTNKDSTRVYTDTKAKGVSGGFAVGRYGAAKGVDSLFFHTNKDSTRVYVPESGVAGEIGGFAVTGNSSGVTNDYFNVTGNTNIEIIDNENRIMWYPKKSAFLAGDIHVGSVDSVGTNSVAMGYRSIAMGNWSQAFGYKSKALGTYSTAIGFEAESDTNSFALGYSAKATGNDAFAFGSGAMAIADNSFALGSVGLDSAGVITNNTQATGDYSFAFGLGSVSSGKGSFAFGTKNTSSGEYSTAIGYDNQATKYFTTSMGAHSQATGNFSTAIGFYTTASNTASTSFGHSSNASGYSSFAVGFESSAVGYAAVAMGDGAQANSSNSVAIGYHTTAANANVFVTGSNTTGSGQYSFVFGDGSSTGSGGTYSMAGGYQCTANGAAANSLGYQNQASGDVSTALGFSTVTSGDYSFGVGNNNNATGDISICAGFNNTAQAYASLVIGRYNTISGSTNGWISTEPLFVAGNGTNSSARGNALTLYKNGNMTIAGTLTQLSDISLKKNIESISGVLPIIKKIEPVYFEFKNKEIYPSDRQIGFIAQNIQKYYPEMVKKGENGMLSVNYSGMSVILLQAINEQQELIQKQQEENKILKEQIEEINNKLDLLLSK